MIKIKKFILFGIVLLLVSSSLFGDHQIVLRQREELLKKWIGLGIHDNTFFLMDLRTENRKFVLCSEEKGKMTLIISDVFINPVTSEIKISLFREGNEKDVFYLKGYHQGPCLLLSLFGDGYYSRFKTITYKDYKLGLELIGQGKLIKP